MSQEMRIFHHGERHRKARRKRQYWFGCLHDLKKNTNFEVMRTTAEKFTLFVGHYKKPLTVTIKKIKHLCKSRHGQRVQLELTPISSSDETRYVATAIYNKNNHSMVIKPIPRNLLN